MTKNKLKCQTYDSGKKKHVSLNFMLHAVIYLCFFYIIIVLCCINKKKKRFAARNCTICLTCWNAHHSFIILNFYMHLHIKHNFFSSIKCYKKYYVYYGNFYLKSETSHHIYNMIIKNSYILHTG